MLPTPTAPVIVTTTLAVPVAAPALYQISEYAAWVPSLSRRTLESAAPPQVTLWTETEAGAAAPAVTNKVTFEQPPEIVMLYVRLETFVPEMALVGVPSTVIVAHAETAQNNGSNSSRRFMRTIIVLRKKSRRDLVLVGQRPQISEGGNSKNRKTPCQQCCPYLHGVVAPKPQAIESAVTIVPEGVTNCSCRVSPAVTAQV